MTTETDKKKQELHIKSKESARAEKARDRELAITDSSYDVITFDLQAVLNTPSIQTGLLYYSRKLSVYNLTVYSIASKKGYCYVWDETQAKRGTAEISSCISLYLSTLKPSVKTVTMFSDCCAGQNRNQFMTVALFLAVQNTPLITINQKFFESGHSQMECDSIHASIEIAKTGAKIYVPSDWHNVIRFSGRTNPVTIVPLIHSAFKDIKSFVNEQHVNVNVTTSGDKIQWLRVKWIQVNKRSDEILFKYSFDEEEEWKVVSVNPKQSRRISTPTTSRQTSKSLSSLYTEPLPIDSKKAKDLMDLCNIHNTTRLPQLLQKVANMCPS